MVNGGFRRVRTRASPVGAVRDVGGVADSKPVSEDRLRRCSLVLRRRRRCWPRGALCGGSAGSAGTDKTREWPQAVRQRALTRGGSYRV